MAKILVAEDDQFLSDAYATKLTQAGYELEKAFDGQEVLQKLETYSPDVIILDLVMPKLDGYSVLEQLKQSEDWKDIPVIVASNLGQKQDIDQAKKLGANDYVVKTDLSMNKLIEKIENLISSSEQN